MYIIIVITPSFNIFVTPTIVSLSYGTSRKREYDGTKSPLIFWLSCKTSPSKSCVPTKCWDRRPLEPSYASLHLLEFTVDQISRGASL